MKFGKIAFAALAAIQFCSAYADQGGSSSVNLKGATDDTPIGNHSDSLNVFATGTISQGIGGASPWSVTGNVGRNWTLSSGTDSVAISNFPSALSVNQATTPWVVSGNVNAVQSGSWTFGRTWNLTSGADSVSVGNFPANQTVTVSNFPSSQTVVVSGTPIVNSNTRDGASTLITSTLVGSKQGLDVNVITSSIGTVNQGNPNGLSNAWPVVLTNGTNSAAISNAGAVKVDGSGVTQPVSGTVAVSGASGNFTVVQPFGINLHADIDNFPSVQPVSGTVTATNPSVGANNGSTPSSSTLIGANDPSTLIQPLQVDSSKNLKTVVQNFPATQIIAGSVSVSNFPATQAVTGTFFQATQPVSISGTVPVSGTVTANAGTNLNTSLLAVESGGHLAAIDNTTTAINGKMSPGTATLSQVALSTSSQSALALNLTRKGAIFVNDSNVAVYLSFSGTATTSAYTVKIQAGGTYEMTGDRVYTGAISVIGSAGVIGNLVITEVT